MIKVLRKISFILFLSFFATLSFAQISENIDDSELDSKIAPYVNELGEHIVDLSIYPNPAKERLNILINFSANTSAELHIFDYLGNILYHENIEKSSTKYFNIIPIEDFRQGMYFIQLKYDEKVITKPFKKI